MPQPSAIQSLPVGTPPTPSFLDVRVEPGGGVSVSADNWSAWIEGPVIPAFGEGLGFDAALLALEHDVVSELDAWGRASDPGVAVPPVVEELRVARSNGRLGELLRSQATLDWDRTSGPSP